MADKEQFTSLHQQLFQYKISLVQSFFFADVYNVAATETLLDGDSYFMKIFQQQRNSYNGFVSRQKNRFNNKKQLHN